MDSTSTSTAPSRWPDTTTGSEGESLAVAPGGDGNNGSNGPGTVEAAPQSGYDAIAVSTALRRDFGGSLPASIADAAFSPLVIGEVLLNSMFGSALAFVLLSLLAVSASSFFVMWPKRKDAGER